MGDRALIMWSDKPDDTQTLRQEVLDRFRAGATIETTHKEGGSRIHFDNGRFVHEQYGDFESRREFTDEVQFLDHLWGIRDWNMPDRHGAPPRTDHEAWQAIVERLVTGCSSRRLLQPSTSARSLAARTWFRQSRLKARFAIVVGAIALILVLLWKTLSPIVQTRTTGAPLGEAVGSPAFIAQLMSRQQTYVPSLHRNPDNDRFDVSLFIRPRDSTATARHIDLAEGYTASESYHAADLLGFDGTLLWLLAGEIAAWDHPNNRLIRLDELRRINPDLEALWPVGHYEVNNRLIVSTRDRKTVVEIDPASLQATRLPTLPPSPHPIPPHPVDAWIIPAEARLVESAGSTDPVQIGPAWVRGAIGSPPMKLGNPESRLHIHWKKIDVPQRMLVVARIATSGAVIWSVDTGIDSLQQILPDSNVTAFIGTRPAVPDKVSEPIMVLINLADGSLSEHSLWLVD